MPSLLKLRVAKSTQGQRMTGLSQNVFGKLGKGMTVVYTRMSYYHKGRNKGMDLRVKSKP